MAAVRLVYIGGGSTRAPGTVAAIVERGAAFAGSEIVLVDLDPDRLDIVRRLLERMATARGVDLRVTATLDRAAALDGADVVLTSFRPGGFEARALDEAIPLRHGVIGQETQGPGGFFMALRTIAVMREIVEEMERRCPDAWLVNYTNPVLVVIAYLQLSVEEFEPLIRRVVTWLTPGGELFMVGHDRSNIEHGVGGPQVPAVLWDVEEIVPWLNGLDILEAEIVERDVVGDDGPRVALDTLIRARLV